MIKNMTVVVYSYPTHDDPVYAFIRPVVCGLADIGVNMSVLSPQSITNAIKRRARIRPYKWVDYSEKGNSILVYQPRYISLSMIRYRGVLLSRILFDRAVKRVYARLKTTPDIVYAHFWESGIAAAKAIGSDNIPLVIACGENHISVIDNYPKKQVMDCIEKVKGVICVSSKNLDECKDMNLISNKMKTKVLPNAIDTAVFKKIDKKKARKTLNWPEEETIAIFVGEFSNRKGVNRVVQAACRLPNLKLVLIGNGKIDGKKDQVLFSGVLPHDQIPLYLNASDFFVLPTLAEGCCNAIVEAMACGLPIISSDLPFNYDILNTTNSILVDPQSIEKIADAMFQMANDSKLRERLSAGSLISAASLSIQARVQGILEFIDSI